MTNGLAPRPGFTGCVVDRADNLRLDESRLGALAREAGAMLLALDRLDPLLDAEGRLRWTEAASLGPSAPELIFLGLRGGAPLFVPLRPTEPGQRAWSVFGLLETMHPEDAALWGTARSLIEWHGRSRFCGSCGGPTRIFRGGWGRRCERCSTDLFPRVDPVAIMLAEHEGKVLVGRQHGYPPGRYSALAGFIEPGESIEEAVARELREEAGVEAEEVRYVASQPWPFPGQLMVACIAPVRSAALVIDHSEIEDAFWVSRDQVAAALARTPDARFLAPPRFAIANTLLEAWLACD